MTQFFPYVSFSQSVIRKFSHILEIGTRASFKVFVTYQKFHSCANIYGKVSKTQDTTQTQSDQHWSAKQMKSWWANVWQLFLTDMRLKKVEMLRLSNRSIDKHIVQSVVTQHKEEHEACLSVEPDNDCCDWFVGPQPIRWRSRAGSPSEALTLI